MTYTQYAVTADGRGFFFLLENLFETNSYVRIIICVTIINVTLQKKIVLTVSTSVMHLKPKICYKRKSEI